ncbi:MAG TPA: hypothetical protein VN648_21940, partial [Candidatus Methylomirabilis sp.]|nr:hypothetical protein [Candidatus Methylomirabilis sp.]
LMDQTDRLLLLWRGVAPRGRLPLDPLSWHDSIFLSKVGSLQGTQGDSAGPVRPEGLGSEQPTDVVEGCSHVDVAVGVDATDDRARCFYDGHSHPFLSLSGEGWHGRPAKE